jgi:hypothetical protein
MRAKFLALINRLFPPHNYRPRTEAEQKIWEDQMFILGW